MLTFFQKLTAPELVEIINKAIDYARELDSTIIFDIAQNTIISDGLCEDEEGRVCVHVKGISLLNGYHFFGDFYFNDYYLWVQGQELIDVSCILRKYFLHRFGSEYQNALKSEGYEETPSK